LFKHASFLPYTYVACLVTPEMMDSIQNFSHDCEDIGLCLEMNDGEINSFLIVKDTGTPSKTSSWLMFSG